MQTRPHSLNLPLAILWKQPEAQRDGDLGSEQEQNTE